jgi:phytoene synthase
MPNNSFVDPRLTAGAARKARFIGGAADYCRKLTTRSRSNFYYAFWFLPRERREALEAIYAYCRLVDDVVDEEAPAARKREGVARWRRELDAVFGDARPSHAVTEQLRAAVRRFASIRRVDMEAVIDGCAMDIDKTRYANWEELRLYCYRVASAVGLMCIEIFGYDGQEAHAHDRGLVATERTQQYAVDLGIALQLTNILRDVGEDARRGRIYLPADELAAHGVSEEDILLGRRTPAMVRLLRAQAERARTHYQRARAALSADERRRLVIAEIMGDIYFALLEQIEASGFDVFGAKATVGRGRKIVIAVGNFARAKLPRLP